MGGACRTLTKDEKYAYTILVGKSEGERSLGRLGRRWEDNIKMNLKDYRV
jgi:hypothetical protein